MRMAMSVSRVCFAVLTLGCGQAGGAEEETPPPDDSPQVPAHDAEADAQAIGSMLDAWHAAAARADEQAYFAPFTANGVFLGTDATERWDRDAFREYAHPHFEEGHGWAFTSIRREIEVHGDIAWFDEDLRTERLGPARGSGVLMREQDGWKIAQYNLALTIPNERFGQLRELLAPYEEGESPGAQPEDDAAGAAATPEPEGAAEE